MKITIEYNGSFPNLCSGELKVYIDNTLLVETEMFGNGLSSGGSVSFFSDWSEEVEDGDWGWNPPDGWLDSFSARVVLVKYKLTPDELHGLILNKINSEIPHGCCGGCV